MKVTFIFRDREENAREMRTSLEIPATLPIPNAREQVLAIASDVGTLTRALLYVSCPTAGLSVHPVKLTKDDAEWPLLMDFRDTILRFDRTQRPRASRKLTIPSPVVAPIHASHPKQREKGSKTLTRYLIKPKVGATSTIEQRDYLNTVSRLASNCLSSAHLPYAHRPGLPEHR